MRTALPLVSFVLLNVACTGGGVIGSDNPDASGGDRPDAASGHPDASGGQPDSASLGTDSGTVGSDSSPGDSASHADSTPPTDSGTGSDGAPSDCPVTEGTQGVVLASGQPSYLRGLALDSDNVYWTTIGNVPSTGGVVGKVSKTGGTVTTLASEETIAFDLLTVGSSVYWTGGDSTTSYIMQMPATGGTPTAFWMSSGLFSDGDIAFSLATDGASLYWASEGNMVTAPLTGGTPTMFNGVPGTTFLEVYGSTLYWPGDFPPSTMTLESIPTSAAGAPTGDPAPTTLWESTTDPNYTTVGIKADATGVYWADQGGAPYDNGVIRAVPTGSSTAIVLASGINYLEGLAIDGANVYFAESQGVSKVPIGGGTTTVVVSNEFSTGNVQVDETNVYWTNLCFGTVKKIAK